MDWFAATCGGAALYAATRWLQGTLQRRRSQTNLKGRRRGIPLKAVVANCEAKWFLQELQQAMSGDHTAMVRVSHMLLVGYGTRQDEAAAANWMRKAWAVQNFKEPADPYLQYELLDFQNSDIPVLNDPQQQHQDCKEQEGLHNASRLQAAAAAGAQAAAHLRQRQRRSGSASSTTAAAAAGSADAVSKLQSSPQARAVLDGGYSSSSSSGSSGAQGSSNSAAGRGMGGGGGSSRASSQAVHQTDTAVPAAATDMQQQGAELQQHTDSVPQQTQLQAQPEQQLVVGLQQQLAAVHAAAAHGCHRHQQQQQQHGGPPLQQWPVQVQVQVLSELRSTCSPCDTPSLSSLPLQQLAGGGELQQALFYGSLSGC